MTLARFLIASLSLGLIITSTSQLLQYSNSKKAAHFFELEDFEKDAVVEDFSTSLNPQNLKIAASYHAGKGEEQQLPQQKIEEWCKALSLYGKALTQQPYQARTLLYWANLRQILGSYECAQENTAADFSEVAAFAIAQDPSNSNNRYIAGLLLYWNGKQDKAAKEFEYVLRYAVGLDEVRRNQIFALASQPELLQAIVPARAPQALQYLSWFQKQKNQAEYWTEVLFASEQFKEFKQQTLQFFTQAISNREIPRSKLIEQLKVFSSITLSVSEKKQLNGLYKKILDEETQNDFVSLVNKRSNVSPIVAQLGFISADTRVTKASITNWGREQQATLDMFHASIGIFTRQGDVPQFIEVQCGPNDSLDLQSGQLQLYLSENNISFKEVTNEVSIKQVANGNETIFLFDIQKLILSPSEIGRFWKVHFSNATRAAQCRGPLKNMISVYGTAGITKGDELL